MSGISAAFRRLSSEKQAALIPFIVCGDPDFGASLQAAKALAEGGADMLEIGIPFSDPVADGEVIQRASARAIAGGMNCAKAVDFIRSIRGFFQGPVIVMTYCNPAFKYGFAKFCNEARQAGADGIIVTDAPFEEELDCAGLDRIHLVAKNSGHRTEAILSRAQGFAYLVSFLGTTGSKSPDFKFVREAVAKARTRGIPLCAGFGISTPQDVRQLVDAGCDGVVVGSAICRIIAKGGDGMPSELRGYCRALKEATKREGTGHG